MTSQKLQVSSQQEAYHLVQSNNDNLTIILRTLIFQTSTKQNFFESCSQALLTLPKLSLKDLYEILQAHSLEQADKMLDLKPELLQKLRATLRNQ